MKRIIMFIILTLILVPIMQSSADNENQNDILGVWLAEGEQGNMELIVYQCGDNLEEYCGKIISIEANVETEENPEDYYGRNLFTNFKYNKKRGSTLYYIDGIMHNLKTGETHNGLQMRYNLGRPNELKFGISIRWKTMYRI